MPIPQVKFREVVLQALYATSLGNMEREALTELMGEELAMTKSTVRQAFERVDAIYGHLEEIDPIIEATSSEYAHERMHTVELAILRLAVFELSFDKNVPPKVAIAEAIRLARKFSTPESASFINAIVDAIYRARTEEPAP